MNWTPITPETLPPTGRAVLLWKDGRVYCWFLYPTDDISQFTHYCIPTPPGTPPAPTFTEQQIEDAVRSYRCVNTVHASDPHCGVLLSDALTPHGQKNIKLGLEEVDSLIDHLCCELLPTPGTPPAVPAEVKAVLGVDQVTLTNAACTLRDMGCPGMEEVLSHIDAIRAARAALGMETKEQQP